MRSSFSFFCVFWGFLPISILATPTFSVEKPYPSLELRMRTLASSKPVPVPSPHVYTVTFTCGDTERKEDLCAVSELWFGTQCAGQWHDREGNILLLARPSSSPPTDEVGIPVNVNGVSRRLISREAFDRTAGGDFAPDSAAELVGWVSAFTGTVASEPVALRAPFGLTRAFFVPLKSDRSLAWLFRAKLPGGGESPWFCAVVTAADNTSYGKVRKNFEMQFLPHVRGLPDSAGTAARGAAQSTAKGTPLFRTKATGNDVTETPGRAAARAGIANMKGWWYADTDDYIFLSDIRSSYGKALLRSLRRDMPALRKSMTELIPPYQNIIDVSVVRIFEERDAYRQYLGDNMEWSIGCWTPARRELVILSQGKEQEDTQRILQHEGFHQYLFYASDMIENALWYNEGHACYFEGAEVDRKGRVSFKETARKLFLKQNLAYAVSRLPFVLSADHTAFYSGTNRDRSLNYAVAWALVWYLRQGIPARSPYSRILSTYRKELLHTRNSTEATLTAFRGIPMSLFQKNFTSYWLSQK